MPLYIFRNELSAMLYMDETNMRGIIKLNALSWITIKRSLIVKYNWV
jgi:hypothetical protein